MSLVTLAARCQQCLACLPSPVALPTLCLSLFPPPPLQHGVCVIVSIIHQNEPPCLSDFICAMSAQMPTTTPHLHALSPSLFPPPHQLLQFAFGAQGINCICMRFVQHALQLQSLHINCAANAKPQQSLSAPPCPTYATPLAPTAESLMRSP